MCGIAGFLDTSRRPDADTLRAVAGAMSETLHHRGPDAQGVWVDAEAGIALGHRRLSILDLSPAGAQPMLSHDGRYVIVFNGEIYNFEELRTAVEATQVPVAWRGHSDTEILLEAIARFGLDSALKQSVGMFALAVWDRAERTLTLARDRAGEKPLYYGWCGRSLVFGSELKALRAHPDWRGSIDRTAAGLLLQFSYIPAPHSIYSGVRKLPPGTWLTVAADAAPGSFAPPQPYWSFSEVAAAAVANRYRGTDDEAVEELDGLLRRSISQQMVADVPVGAFLSGGIDSSTVVAIMQRLHSLPVRTYSIAFEVARYNEAPFAEAVAAHIGTRHTTIPVSEKEAAALVTSLPSMYDEPQADPSQIPTFFVSQLARREVTVSLTGDAGDELFGGYSQYLPVAGVWKSTRRVPHALRPMAGAGLDVLARALNGASNVKVGAFSLGGLPKLARTLGAPQFLDCYELVCSRWLEGPLARTAGRQSAWQVGPAETSTLRDPLELMMFQDFRVYLPDSVLTKVDRAAMSVSLETRVPLLDHRIIELAWRLPIDMKFRDGQGKWILRKLLDRYVPRPLVDRPKKGFGVPMGDWLRGPLKAWAGDLLAAEPAPCSDVVPRDAVERRWREHLAGRRDWSQSLWSYLTLQSWWHASGH